ncbi:MAG: homocysteine S-methyltransferase family protein [Ignavibacteriales bacterium]|nr:homocysteine S-methyltransferase family protein [Ignavibacteriales bacterium]
MKFEEAVKYYSFILTEGSVVERIRRSLNFKLDEHIANSALIYNPGSKTYLEIIYRQYLNIGQKHNLPMIILTPTWRANKERLIKTGFAGRNVNRDNFLFLDEIRKSYGEYAEKVFIGGLIGCKGDAYNPDEALSREDAEEFHSYQLRTLANAGVDFLIASTLPAVSEAEGIAEAMSKTGLPYILSFIIRVNSNLLDGTPLIKVINKIDSSFIPDPTCYMVNCIHPTIFQTAIENNPQLIKRVWGIQANTSCKSPEELDGAGELDAEEPEIFANELYNLHSKFGIKILGGCCGTDERHIEQLAIKSLQLSLDEEKY